MCYRVRAADRVALAIRFRRFEMKVTGIVLAVLSGLLVLSSLRLAATEYDFHSTHDISKFAGGLALAVFILVGGITLIKKAKGQ
jgi:hypothetical protein